MASAMVRTVHVTAHAIRRYAERVLLVDTTALEAELRPAEGLGSIDQAIVEALRSRGLIDIAAIRAALTTPAVVTAAALARKADAIVKVRCGRLSITVGTFQSQVLTVYLAANDDRRAKLKAHQRALRRAARLDDVG